MNFKEYWNSRKETCKFWDQKSEEDKHFHTWLYGMTVGAKSEHDPLAQLKVAVAALEKLKVGPGNKMVNWSQTWCSQYSSETLTKLKVFGTDPDFDEHDFIGRGTDDF